MLPVSSDVTYHRAKNINVLVKIAIAGAIVGFLETFSIWFVPEEPYPNFIVMAGVLKGALTALLVSKWIDNLSTLSKSLAVGAVVGFLMAGVVFLAKGGWASLDAPFIVPSGVVSGLIIGGIVRYLNRVGGAAP